LSKFDVTFVFAFFHQLLFILKLYAQAQRLSKDVLGLDLCHTIMLIADDSYTLITIHVERQT